MNIREYISIKNLKGVQDFAISKGLNVPSNSKEAYILLSDIYSHDMNFAKNLFRQLHPDLFLFNPKPEMVEKPGKCSCSEHRGADGISSALSAVENASRDTLKEIKDSIDKQDDRVLKYGLVLLAGVLVGKFLIK